MTAIYSARWVLPIISAPIEDGAVAFQDSKIVAVGPREEIVARFPAAKTSDFGKAAILPGLVNAHSHLELTVMRGFLEREESDFFAWLRKLTTARLSMSAAELCASAMGGAIEAARAGITCLADSSSSASEVMKAVRQIGMRAIVYQESFGPDPIFAGENMARLCDQLGELRDLETDLVRSGVSPHAPYTVSGLQLELISRLALDEKVPLMMHAAESDAERLFLLKGAGVFAEGLKKRGIDWHAPGLSTIQYLKRHGILETKPLLAHCINVDDADLQIIRENGAGISHCPKSNAKLGHGRAPFAEFISHEVRVGLGSDSVASNNNCDLIEEARFATLLARLDQNSGLLSEPPAVAGGPTANHALFTATLGGARALGLDDQIGALMEGMQADLVVVGLDGAHQVPSEDPVDTLVFSSSGRDVLVTMVAGKEIYREGCVTSVDEKEIKMLLEKIRSGLDLAT